MEAIRSSETSVLSYSIVFLRSVLRLLVAANDDPNTPILGTLIKEVTRYSETSVITRTTRRNIPEDYILPCIYAVGRKPWLGDQPGLEPPVQDNIDREWRIDKSRPERNRSP
jgi:hypothetical protein